MWNLLKLELRRSKFKWANIIIILLNISRIVLVYIFKNSEHNYINEIYFIAIAFGFLYISDSEIDKTDIIMNSIPVSKRQIVNNNYITLLIIFIISLIYTLIYFGILKVLGFDQLEALSIKHIIISLSIFIIHTSILLPIYHISPRIMYAFFTIISFYTGRSIVTRNKVAIERLLLGNGALILFLVSLILLIISILISYHNYNKREFVRG